MRERLRERQRDSETRRHRDTETQTVKEIEITYSSSSNRIAQVPLFGISAHSSLVLILLSEPYKYKTIVLKNMFHPNKGYKTYFAKKQKIFQW